MTVSQMRQFCNKKPTWMSWEEFDKLEVAIMTEFGIEYLSEFEEGSGVTAICPNVEEGQVDSYIFAFLTEDFEAELHPHDEMDTFLSAEEELRMYNLQDLEYNLN